MRAVRVSVAAVLTGWLGFFAGAGPAGAIEVMDGRVEVHGYYEMQLRAIARDWNSSDDWDLTQWYHILNIEVEADILPDGFGPIDLMSGFARIEARYDCIWKRGCGMFSSVDAFGDRTKRLPKRLSDGRRAGFRSTGAVFNTDTRAFRDIPREFLPFRFRDRPDGSRVLSPIFSIEGIDTLFDSPGADGVFASEDDPAPFYFSDLLDDKCDFTFRKTRGSSDGIGTQVMGPWQPACKIEPLGKLRFKPNPLRARDYNPITGAGGSGALPLRPAPEVRAGSNPLDVAQGVYFPNEVLAERIRNGDFDSFDQNFREEELAWNHGASQQDEKELKELYLDIEMADSRLWLRLGKQAIVWGKTELFRNQDQWNPQDLGLASLPSLEESRIALWGGRAVWHFYEVGPLSDVRAELVFLYDQFEPTDLGRCGEPYAPNPVCNKSLGLLVHGLTGFGVAGEVRPPDPWNSWKGIEVGGRLEWRWSRFSFALTDYWGYTDLPYQENLFVYSRNVDPVSGRPRQGQATGECRTGREAACLRPSNALEHHSANQQVFHMICATSIGFSELDLSACGQTVFNSQALADETNPQSPTVALALANVLSGQGDNTSFSPISLALNGGFILESLGSFNQETFRQLGRFSHIHSYVALPAGLGGTFDAFCNTNFPGIQDAGLPRCPTPLVPLNRDPNDGAAAFAPSIANVLTLWAGGGYQPFLTDEQEALLGCGPFYGTNCDVDGLDLMNAEASALFQSFPGFEGTTGDFNWDTTSGRAQPGTTGFDGGPVCTRYERGRMFVLPGCRGPGDAGYDVRVDGSIAGLIHPFTGQQFRSEMAALSWNALLGLVAFSGLGVPESERTESEFLPSRPFRKDGCSFARPLYCDVVQSFFQITGVQRNIVRAGGNGRFGRRDFTWHGGKDVALRYEKRNILGFSMDFAEDFTKSNVGLEFTWENDVFLADNNSFEGITEADLYNLTLSIDRPTFVNFLNANRTLFMNAQIFFQYVDGYRDGFTGGGPWNFLGVFTIQTGYFDDRLLPGMSLVYDKRSNSGAFLPQVQYRYTAEFSVTFGVALFMGREEPRPAALTPVGLGNRAGRHAYDDFVENGLSAVRDRDEIFLRLRYTF